MYCFQIITLRKLWIHIRRFNQISDRIPRFFSTNTNFLSPARVLPEVGLTVPSNMRMVVVLPAPFRPRNA